MTYEFERAIKGICIGLAIVLLLVGLFAAKGYILSHEVESYDAVFEIVDANEMAVSSMRITRIYHTLFIQNVDDPNESYKVNVNSSEYNQCGVGRLAVFNVKVVETIFGRTTAIVTFQSVE